MGAVVGRKINHLLTPISNRQEENSPRARPRALLPLRPMRRKKRPRRRLIRKCNREKGQVDQISKLRLSKLERNLSQKGEASPVIKGKRVMRAGSSMSSSAFQASPPKERWAWGSVEPAAKPRWGILKSFEAHQDDLRMNSEWDEDGEKKDREDSDKRVERGKPPAPKEKHGASSMKSSRTQEGKMWGEVRGENTMNFDPQMTPVVGGDDHSCEDGPDCKFRSLDEGEKKRKGKPFKPPKKKKA